MFSVIVDISNGINHVLAGDTLMLRQGFGQAWSIEGTSVWRACTGICPRAKARLPVFPRSGFPRRLHKTGMYGHPGGICPPASSGIDWHYLHTGV